MPTIALPVDESYCSNLRPVVEDIVRSIICFTGLPLDFPVQYPGVIGTAANPGSTINEYAVQDRFIGDNLFQVEVIETPKEERILTTAVNQLDNLAIVADANLGVYIRPVYTVTDVTITVRCTHRSHTAAVKWLNQFRYKASQGRVESCHEVNYHYPIPLEMLAILNHIGGLKEAQGGYNESLRQWYSRVMTPKRRVISNLAGSGKRLVIGERQVGLLGAFDFTVQPQSVDKAGEAGGWVVGFDYTFTYDKVSALSMHYPIVIHNQHIDLRFVDQVGAYRLESHKRYPSISRNLLDYHAAKRTLPHQMMDGIPIPGYDDWLPKRVRNGTQSLLRVLTQFTPADLKTLFSLMELGDYALSPTSAAFLKKEGNNIFKFGESVFYGSIYRNTMQLPDGSATMDANLNMSLVNNADIRQAYRFRLALITDFSQLSKAAIGRLKDDLPMFIEIIKTILPDIVIGDITHVTDAIFNKIKDLIQTNNQGYDTSVEKRRLTVGSYIVVSH